MTNCYHDYLVDCALIIGANELSQLIPAQSVVSRDKNNHPVKYKQQIIAAISATVAMFPFSKKGRQYPPESFQKLQGSSVTRAPKHDIHRQISDNDRQTINELVNQYNKNEDTTSISRANTNRRSSKLRSKRRSIRNISVEDANASWGSVSMETMKSFPAIYFNDNLEVSITYVEPKIQFIPLTDNMGNRSFAIRLEFYRKFAISINDEIDEKLQTVSIKTVTKDNEDTMEIIFVPNNVILFTKYPYFDLFRDILSQFYRRIKNADTETIEDQLLEYVLVLTRIPVMKSTSLQLNFTINTDLFSIKPTHPIFTDVIDWDFTILFETLSLDDIISILMAMFQEQKIVFLSNDTNLITIVTETIFLLFRPFYWKHFYLTTTPSHLYELIDAIFPFMLGLPHELKPKIIEHYPDIIIVDLDEGKTIIPTSCQLIYVSKELTNQLKDGLKQRDWLKSKSIISSLNSVTIHEYREMYYNFNINFTQKVLMVFMTFMVDLFEEVIRHISIEEKDNKNIVITFDKYLNTSFSQNVSFFKQIYRTDNFNCFVDERIRRKITDGWFYICTKRYPGLLEESSKRGTLKFESSKTVYEPLGIDIDIFNSLSNGKTKQVVTFPSRSNIRRDFYSDLIDHINNLETTVDVMILLAEVTLTAGYTIKSLEEFNKLLQIIPSGLNHSKLRRLIRGLGKKEFKTLKSMPFHSSLFERICFDERRFSLSSDFVMIKTEQFNPPTNPIPSSNFLDECRNADIAEYETVVNALFISLTLDCKATKNRIKTVQPEIFKCFYTNWINSSIDINEVNMSTDFIDEILIKGTEDCVRVDGYGLGRVILTQYRLCFIPFAKTYCQIIVNFVENNLRKVKNERKLRGFGKITEVLEVSIVDRDKNVIIWLAGDSQLWCQLISEISLANRNAKEEKDKTLLAVTTEQCLMFENMLMCAKENGYFKKNIEEIGKRMLPYSNEKKITKNEEHKKYLIAKLMPSPKDVIRIDFATDIYKPYLDNFDIWCACMSRDRYFLTMLQIIDKKVHKQDVVKIDIPMRIHSMVRLPNTNKMAVCCFSHLVFLVDLNNHVIEKKIELNIGKGAYPIYSTNSEFDQRVLYFGTNLGEILCWNSQTNQVHQIVKLPNEDLATSIHVYDSQTIIVGSLYRFFVINIVSINVKAVEISEFSNMMSKTGCLGLCNNNTTLLVGLARLPVLLEYDISDINNIRCDRRKNIFTNKNFIVSDVSDHYELSPSYIGITTVLSIDDDPNGSSLWIMFKDGTIEIRDSKTWIKRTKFEAHVDVISRALLCSVKKQKIIVSVGKEDGKVNLWNITP